MTASVEEFCEHHNLPQVCRTCLAEAEHDTHDSSPRPVSRPSADTVAGQPPDTTLTTVTTPARSPDLLAEFRTGTYLDAYEPTPLRHIVAGFVLAGLTLFVGAPKRGKSWMVLDWLLAVACGGKALGSIGVQSGPVLYLALEDSERRLHDRAKALLGERTIPAHFHYALRLSQPRAVVQTLTAWLDANADARMVVIDTLARVRPPAANGVTQYEHEYRVLAALKALADERDVAFVVVHHTRKAPGEDWIDCVSGTHGLAGAADTIIALDRPRGDGDGILRITGRDVDESEHAVRMTDGRWTLTGEPPVDPGLSDTMADVQRAVHEGPPTGTDAAMVAARLSITPQRARDYLARHADRDDPMIARVARGRYWCLCRDCRDCRKPAVTCKDPGTELRHPSGTGVVGVVTCAVCTEPLTVTEPGQTIHPNCDPERRSA